MINELLNSLLENDIRTHENIRKFATGPEDDYINGCLINHLYFKENCMLIVIDLSKQQTLDV